jgi:hypothetical protein
LKLIDFDSSAWVPMMISILPCSSLSRVALASAAGTSRDSRPISIGKPWNRSTKF